MARPTGYMHFSFPIEAYHPDALRSGYTEKELRREYSRLRSVAVKRLEKIGRSEFAGSQTYRYNANRYVKLSQVTDARELTYLLTDLRRFLGASTGSVSGLRAARDKAIETWREQGFDFVNKSTYSDWVDFLEFAKDRVGFEYSINIIGKIFEERTAAGRNLATIKRTFMRYYNRYADNQS